MADVVPPIDWPAAVRALVDALPKCDGCGRPATRAWSRESNRWCDEHAPRGCPEYPRAQPLRRVLAMLRGEVPR